jgi:phage terminase large subunit
MYYSTNPGGIGHEWFKKMFIVPAVKGTEDRTKFIFSTYKDNAFLNPEYIDYLLGLKGGLGKAWRDGDWDAFEGQAFPSWNEENHVISVYEWQQIQQEQNFDLWPKWRATDWGFSAPWCCLWLAKNILTQHVYAYRELYKTGIVVPNQARLIREVTPGNENISHTFADPSMWARSTVDDDITSTADKYAENGVILTKADNDRLSGKRKVDEMLSDSPDGKPYLQIVESCTNLIRTMPLLPTSESNPEDVETKAEDHAYDALRYGLSNQNLTPSISEKVINKRSPLGRIF